MTGMLKWTIVPAAALCVLLATGGLAVAAEKGQASRGPLVLKVSNLPDSRSDAPIYRAERAVIRAFKEKYPNIEPVLFSGISIEGQDMGTASRSWPSAPWAPSPQRTETS